MTGRGAEPFSGDTLRTSDPKRIQQLRVVDAIITRFPERNDFMPLLQMLLAPSRPSGPKSGHQAHPAVHAARSEWLGRCREWLREHGVEPPVRQIARIDQLRYEAATGDVWQAILAEVGK